MKLDLLLLSRRGVKDDITMIVKLMFRYSTVKYDSDGDVIFMGCVI